MKFLWPGALLLLVTIPLLVGVFIWLKRRRRRYTLRYSSLSLIREALPAQSRLRRYLPMGLLFLAITSLAFGIARPVTVTSVPGGRATVMLVLDISHSMLQTDIKPSRLVSAKGAALYFIARQQANNQIGIVAFNSIAQLVQPPTTDPEALELAVRNLTTGRGTAIGSGILTALDTIAEYNLNVAPSTRGETVQNSTPPIPDGEYLPDIVVMLTDGMNNAGFDPMKAAQQAVERRIRVYTIGFGTSNGMQERGNTFSGRGGRGIDEASLKKIASMTGGEYYSAESAAELQKVFASLPVNLFTREESTELSVVFAALAAVSMLAALLFSQLWHPLP